MALNWQSRNMVKLTHEPTQLKGEANEHRSQHRNRNSALAQLRSKLALDIAGPKQPSRVVTYRLPDQPDDDLNLYRTGMPTPDELENYRKCLATHDWYYEYSDDNHVYQAGVKARNHLVKLQMAHDPTCKIWNEIAPAGWKRNPKP